MEKLEKRTYDIEFVPEHLRKCVVEEWNKTLYLQASEGEPKCVGKRYRFIFDNGYGASLVKTPGSYGYEDNLWEMAVLKKNSDGEYHIFYGLAICPDIIGYLEDDEVVKYLEYIKNRKGKQ